MGGSQKLKMTKESVRVLSEQGRWTDRKIKNFLVVARNSRKRGQDKRGEYYTKWVGKVTSKVGRQVGQCGGRQAGSQMKESSI